VFPAASLTDPPSSPGRRVVVLTHGFMAHRLLLKLFAARLRRAGWETRIWGYESFLTSVTHHAGRFSAYLGQLEADEQITQIHLVTHSMGCIIGRMAIAKKRPRKLGRFVMLTPPNRGSFVASAMPGIVGRVFRPVAELTTAPDSLVNSLADPDNIDVGIIAAAQDSLVSLESTKLAVPHEHITLPCLHSAVLFRRDAAALTDAFLRTGLFSLPLSSS
jgi:pimeloyl-ACP methyl ester carboxylesterase